MLFSYMFGAGQRLAPPGNAMLMARGPGDLRAGASRTACSGFDAKLRGRLPGWMV